MGFPKAWVLSILPLLTFCESRHWGIGIFGSDPVIQEFPVSSNPILLLPSFITMECYQTVQYVNGICHGNYANLEIRAQLFFQSNPVGNPLNVSCLNGQVLIPVTRPNHPSLETGTGFVAFDAAVEMWGQKDAQLPPERLKRVSVVVYYAQNGRCQ